MEAARRLYSADGDKETTLAAFGLPASLAKSFEDKPCYVWGSNWKTLELFAAMSTQWRVGMAGATGLDYTALPIVARSLNIKLTPARFGYLRAMERTALDVMKEAHERK